MSDPFAKFIADEKDLESELDKVDEEPDISSYDEEEQISGDDKEISGLSYFLDLILNIVIIFGTAWFVRMIVVSPFYVDGQSMMPTLEHHDFLVVDKLSYHIGDPDRGDVVIARPPDHPEVFYVKRVIGLPGETIEFINGKIRIKNDEHPEGWELSEKYLNAENMDHTYLPSRRDQRVYIPEESYFLVGDNRNHSSDSRTWFTLDPESGGAVSRKMIVGRAIVRAWIPEKIFWKIGIPHFEIVKAADYE